MPPNKKVKFQTISVDNTSVNFPFEPYDLQINYMHKVLECVKHGQNGLLESPTGTGKTLSLLCSTLAWLESAKASAQLAKLQGAGQVGVEGAEWGPAPRHKVIYSSRTHSQLSQAMAELNTTTYNYLKVSILGSRDQLCVNPAVMEATGRDRVNMCQVKVKAKSCTFHQNVEKAKDREELRDNQLMDIEDLHKLGKKHNFCPFYMSRELYQSADIIFMPYNYLLDEKTRKSLDIDLNGAVLIFDEAHNINKMCEEAASVQLTSTDIALALKDLETLEEEVNNPPMGFDEAPGAAKDFNIQEIQFIKMELLKVEEMLPEYLKQSDSVTKKGEFIQALFGSFRPKELQHSLELMVTYATSSGQEGVSTKGRGLAKLYDFISGAFNENIKPDDLEKLYKVHLAREEKKKVGGGFLKSKSENIVLNLWCFSPGFSMQRLARLGPRSIILTSGTLSPLNAFSEELGVPFPVRLENKHIISASQVWCGVISQGPDGTVLNSSFKNRSDPKYLNSLGQSIINMIKLIPAGVLVFFPSYSVLNSCREFWQNSGVWSRIDQIKTIFVEPQKKEALSITMKEYYARVKDPNGACFFAVCRGKVAEGLDFADDNGRAVLVTGLPYPPLKDPRVELKRQFLDERMRAREGTVSGSKWYSLEAFRATNQAIGRVIRHSRDHGAIVFLDSRFKEQNACQSLSSWLQPFFQRHSSLGSAVKGLAGFFKVDSDVGRMRQEAVAAQAKIVNRSKGNESNQQQGMKRPLEQVEENTCSREMYSQKTVSPKEKEADSIFSTTSCGISFGTLAKSGCFTMSAKTESSENKTSVDRGIVMPKKKKIRLVAPKPEEKKQSVSYDEESKASASNYVKLLKEIVTKDELMAFVSSIKKYKVENNFTELIPMLRSVIMKHAKQNPNLIQGFGTFVKGYHMEQFKTFCDTSD